jgi:hypothetical protein
MTGEAQTREGQFIEVGCRLLECSWHLGGRRLRMFLELVS